MKTIVVETRPGDFRAHLVNAADASDKSISGFGLTRGQAIADLLISHPETVGINVVIPEESPEEITALQVKSIKRVGELLAGPKL